MTLTERERRLFVMLCEACAAFEGEEDSVKVEHADLITDMNVLIDEIRPLREYLFDIRLNASIRVEAGSEAEARAMLLTIDANTANLGAWPNGDPIICEVSVFENAAGGDLKAVEIDGVEVGGLCHG